MFAADLKLNSVRVYGCEDTPRLISNILTDDLKVKHNLPYWDRLHGFWHTLPNFNPTVVTSDAGQDIVAQALKLTQRHIEPDDGKEEPLSDWSRSPSPTPATKSTLTRSEGTPPADDNTHPLPNSDNSQSNNSVISFSSVISSCDKNEKKSASSTPLNLFVTPTAVPTAKAKAKSSRAEAFADEMKAETETLAMMTREKHARKLEELKCKRRKLDYASQKENHQREREEEHELHMFQLRLQFQQQNSHPVPGGFGSSHMVNTQLPGPSTYCQMNGALYDTLGAGLDGLLGN
ncbi:hypothetical protein K438DRAFT_1762457 [Mycena galopus ATCC 62051]|nr:hypothetical protein K438DRAFT_1762457 [Mycena galopus ATCC 62051]